MSEYFSAFPQVRIAPNSVLARNILSSFKILERARGSASSFYKMEIRPEDTPTSIAYDYYGSVNYVWLVYLSNQIVDPYFEWYLNDQAFDQFIVAKYGSVAQAQAKLLFYRNAADTHRINELTFNNLDDAAAYTPVYAYDEELRLNEARRFIRLIDRELAPKLFDQLRSSLRTGNVSSPTRTTRTTRTTTP